MTESQLQQACVRWLQIQQPDCVWFAVPNQGRRGKANASRMKAEGLRAGVADLVFILPGGRAAFIEMKSRLGRLSPSQQTFKREVEALQCPYVVCRSFDEFVGTVRGFATC